MTNSESAAVVPPRIRNLDNPYLIGAVYLISMALLTFGEIRSSVPYTDPLFVVEYFWTELQVAGLFLFVTAFFLDWKRIGFNLPTFSDPKKLLPLLMVTGAGMTAWIITLITLPAGVNYDIPGALATWRTTAVVGLTEEWMYRGILFVFFSRWFGLRKGSFIALTFFGILHLINIVGGVPLPAAAFQFFNTMLLGSVFILAAISTRSLLIPIICHGLYDLFVIEASKLHTLGSSEYGSLLTVAISIPVGIYSIIRIGKLEGKEPFVIE
ncbi:MAG: CPBP family intramembrane metalloprotease [Bacteroidetes bacterium]|nr:CPBP family intramembrane metalloprotease [Bacteroidota bacterium]